MNDTIDDIVEPFNLKGLILFFCIAFGWTWFWNFLFISGLFVLPEDLGTSDFNPFSVGPIIFGILLMPFGPTIGAFVTSVVCGQ